METYTEMKKRQQKKIDNFEGMFFAFSNKQFEEGMIKVGLDKKDTTKVCRFMSSGYLKKDKLNEFKNLMKQHKTEKENNLKNIDFLTDALNYELNNHEFCITGDMTDALNVLGIEEKDIPSNVMTEVCKPFYN